MYTHTNVDEPQDFQEGTEGAPPAGHVPLKIQTRANIGKTEDDSRTLQEFPSIRRLVHQNAVSALNEIKSTAMNKL